MHYKVKAKCGHVGRNNYIVQDFFIVANSRREAAAIVRWMPRVKHHKKDAIFFVEEITFSEYREGRAIQEKNPYFKTTNSSEQKEINCLIYEDIYRENDTEIKQTRNPLFRLRKFKIKSKEAKIMAACAALIL